jgi:hypothetical protein
VVTRVRLAPMMWYVPFVVGALRQAIVSPFGGCSWRPEDTIRSAAAAAGSASRLFIQTITPDTTLIQPSGEGAPDKNGMNVQDLPNLLFIPQVAAAHPAPGSTCWQVCHASGEVSLRTEEGICATVGPANDLPGRPSVARRDSAALVVPDKVLGSGTVWERLSQAGCGDLEA